MNKAGPKLLTREDLLVREERMNKERAEIREQLATADAQLDLLVIAHRQLRGRVERHEVEYEAVLRENRKFRDQAQAAEARAAVAEERVAALEQELAETRAELERARGGAA